MSTQIKWREANGRFDKPPSLEACGMVKICACGKILLKETDWSSGFPVSRFPDKCPKCEAPQNK
jgi:hypothetical protein